MAPARPCILAWKIEFAGSAEKELTRFERPVIRRILRFLNDRVSVDPRAVGQPLRGELSDFWRYRIGNDRLYANIQDERVTVLVVKVGHRRDVYRKRCTLFSPRRVLSGNYPTASSRGKTSMLGLSSPPTSSSATTLTLPPTPRCPSGAPGFCIEVQNQIDE
jgi:mRNA interferase RelE/StbE